jgi:hypothetical protein
MVNSPTFVGRAGRSESRFHSYFAARRGLTRLVRFRGGGRFCDQLSGAVLRLGLTPPRLTRSA